MYSVVSLVPLLNPVSVDAQQSEQMIGSSHAGTLEKIVSEEIRFKHL